MPTVLIPELGRVKFDDGLTEAQLTEQVSAAVDAFQTQQRASLAEGNPFARYQFPDVFNEPAPSLAPVTSLDRGTERPAAFAEPGGATPRPHDPTADPLLTVKPDDPAWSPQLRGALKVLRFQPPPGVPVPPIAEADRQAIRDQLSYENTFRAEQGRADLNQVKPIPGLQFHYELTPDERAVMAQAPKSLQRLAGWVDTVNGFLDFLNSAEGVELGVLMAGSGPIGIASRVGIGADMIHGAVLAKDELALELAKPEADRDPVKVGQLESQLGLSVLMAGSLLGKEAGRGVGKTLPAESRWNQPPPLPDFAAWLKKLRPDVWTKTSRPYVRGEKPAGYRPPFTPSPPSPPAPAAAAAPAAGWDVMAAAMAQMDAQRATLRQQLDLLDREVAARLGLVATGTRPENQPNRSPVPVPETAATLEHQFAELKRGKRAAVLITPGEPMPDVPNGLQRIKTAAGIFIFDPAKITPEAIGQAVDANRIGDVLDYGIPAKPEPGTEVGAVTVRDPQGVEKRAVVTDAENLPNVVDAAQAVADPADTIALEPPQQVLEQRVSSTPEASPETEAAEPRAETPPAAANPVAFKVGDRVRHEGKVKTVTRVTPGSEFIGVGKRAVKLSEVQPMEKPAQGGDVRPSEQRTAPQTGETTTPPKPEPVKRVARGLRARKVFDAETELQGPDILSWINENMRLLSKSEAQRTLGKDWWRKNQSLYDDAAPLQRPHHNIIYGGESRPDQVAQAAYDARVLKAPDVPELWSAIRRASNARAKAFENSRREARHYEEAAKEFAAWQKATAKGEARVEADDLRVGDVLDIEGERTEVTAIDPDTGTVTLKDGTRFGVQQLESGQAIYVEEFKRLDEAPEFLPEEEAPNPELPKVPAQSRNLSRNEQKQFVELSLKAKAARESGEPGLTTEETQRYESLLAAVGQGELLSPASDAGVAARVAELRTKLEQLEKLRVQTQNRAWDSRHRRAELFKEAKAYEAEAQRVRQQIHELAQADQRRTDAGQGSGDGWFSEGSPPRELAGGELGDTPPKPPVPPEDNPRHSVFDAVPMEMPEAVRTIKALLGVYPKIREQLGKYAGVFRHMDALGKGEVRLRADLFELLTAEEKTKLLDEAKRYAEETAGPGDNKRRIAAERYKFLYEQALEEAKQRNPVQAMKVIWHEIGHVVDWLPDHLVRGRGNLLARFASLKNYLKHVLPLDPNRIGPFQPKPDAKELRALEAEALRQLREEMGPIREIVKTIIVEEPEWRITGITPQDVINILGEHAGAGTPELTRWFAEQDSKVKAAVLRKAMRGLLDERLAAMGKKEQVGVRRTEKTVREKVVREPTPAELKVRFRELLQKEIEARNIADLKIIKAELEPAIAWWRGTATMEEYFRPASEMYAEAFSIFANNPAALEKRAPTYAKVLWNYLDRKPEVKRLYDEIQAQIKAGDIMPGRVKALYEMWDLDDARSMAQAREALKLNRRDFLDNVVYHIDRRFGPVYRAAKDTPAEGRVKSAVGNYLYRMAEHERYLGALNREVGQWLVQHNLDWSHDLGEYLFHRRVTQERFNLANPLGWTPKNSLERLAEIERTLGPVRWRALVEAGRRFQELRQTHVAAELLQSGMFTEPLAEAIATRADYATFAAVKELPDHGIEKLLESHFGSGVSAHIYRQIGNLGEIKNPATATVLKGLSLISAVARNTMKREVVAMLRQAHPEDIMPAKVRWNGKAREPVIVDNHPDVGTIVYMANGRPQAYYVRKIIADAVNATTPAENAIYSALIKASGWQKAIFTQLNYAFWPVNFVRDALGWWMQMPGVGTPFAWAKNLPKALVAARQSVTHAQPNAAAEAALRRKMLISQGDPRGVWAAAENEYEARLASYGMNPAQWNAEAGKVHAVVKAWNAYRELGQTIERVNKISGMLYLDEKFPAMPEWKKREIVRERAGSPNFLERGASNPAVDMVFLFYNPWKEGLRSLVHSARERPYSFTAKATLAIATPTILQAAAVNGWLGSNRQEEYGSIPDYDLTNYLCVPLGWVDRAQGKLAYLRLPLWEPARIAHGTMFQTLTARGQGVLSHAGGQLPGLNPLWKSGLMWGEYLLGKNPVDLGRGVNVLTDKQFAAGGAQAAGQLAKQTWNDLGGGIVHRFRNLNLESSPESSAEDLLGVPLVSNALGRWIKVSDRGLVDRARAAAQPVEQRRAQIQLGVDEVLRRMTTGGAYPFAVQAVVQGDAGAFKAAVTAAQLSPAEKQLLRDPYALQYFLGKFPDVVASKASTAFRIWNDARSNEGRAAILKAGVIGPNRAGVQ